MHGCMIYCCKWWRVKLSFTDGCFLHLIHPHWYEWGGHITHFTVYTGIWHVVCLYIYIYIYITWLFLLCLHSLLIELMAVLLWMTSLQDPTSWKLSALITDLSQYVSISHQRAKWGMVLLLVRRHKTRHARKCFISIESAFIKAK